MKTKLAGLIGVLMIATPSAGAAADAQLMAPINQFIDSFNKGDAAAAEAAHAKDGVMIVDEPAPHLWQGAGAFKAWAADLEKDAKAKGQTDQMVKVSPATREEVTGDRAYVIVPAAYSFKEKGVAMRAEAQMTYVLRKGADGWKIQSWTWTGPRATPAK
ncbi:nuclear transport factor 2 family protein [Phenylobacterium sp.]|uniref:nuclear transport factor 2 family protein n=1 Tax=Phenylobacterium sp. TaxID=1871053 RepID=UPI002EDB3627